MSQSPEHVGPFRFSEVLRDEYSAIRGGKWDTASEDDLMRQMDHQAVPLSALCLSGEGVGSVMFGLGVIQALAEEGILTDFDYLSTVSGGSCIGGWLTAWKQRANGIDEIVRELFPFTPPPELGRPDAVRKLRQHISYFNSMTSLFSIETWTIVATIVRNTLLKCTAWLPPLLLVLMIPRFVLALARRGVTDHGSSELVGGMMMYLIPEVSGLLFSYAIFNALLYLPGVGRQKHTEFDFLKHCLLPLVGAATSFAALNAWCFSYAPGRSATNLPSFRALLVWITVSALAGWVGYLVADQRSWGREPRLILGLTSAILLVGFTTATVAWLLAAKLYQIVNWPLYLTLAPPLLLLGTAVGCIVFIGITSNLLHDEDREWFSTAGAWLLLFVSFWVSLCFLVFLGPPFVLTGHISGTIDDAGKWKFLWQLARGSLVALAGAAGGSVGLVNALISRPDSRGSAAPSSSGATLILNLFQRLLAAMLVLALVIGLTVFTDWLLDITGLLAGSGTSWWQHASVIENTGSNSILILSLAFLGFSVVMSQFINVNKFSLNRMYRDRVIRNYLGASGQRRDANMFTGFAESDNLQMGELNPRLKPFHVINMALYLVHGARLARKRRRAESFTVTPLHSGHSALGYRPSNRYGGAGGMSLGSAMSASGADAVWDDSYLSSPLLAAVTTLFKPRVGIWLGNPGNAGAKTWRLNGPRSMWRILADKYLELMDDRANYVYLMDGRHFDGLAIYEMIRRGCGNIVAVDCSRDPDFKCEDLGVVLRKVFVDFGIPIEFDDSFQRLRARRTRFAVATIRYSALATDRKDGFLIYIKPVMLGDEPPDVTAYQAGNPEFPHERPGEYSFNEPQTESYRRLGVHTLYSLCRRWNGEGGLKGLMSHFQGEDDSRRGEDNSRASEFPD